MSCWWVDEEYWPGPTEYQNDILAAVELLGGAARQWGKTVQRQAAVMKQIAEMHSLFFHTEEHINWPAYTGPTKFTLELPPTTPKNHGPRPKSTFDRRGRRRY